MSVLSSEAPEVPIRQWVLIWELEGKECEKLEHGATARLAALATISSTEIRLLTTSQDETARLWALELEKGAAGVRDVRPLAVLRGSPDGKQVLTTSQAGTVRLWPAVFADAKKLARERASRDFTEAESERYSDLILEGPRNGQ